MEDEIKLFQTADIVVDSSNFPVAALLLRKFVKKRTMPWDSLTYRVFLQPYFPAIFFEKQVLLGAVVCTGAQYTAQWAIMGPKIVLK